MPGRARAPRAGPARPCSATPRASGQSRPAAFRRAGSSGRSAAVAPESVPAAAPGRADPPAPPARFSGQAISAAVTAATAGRAASRCRRRRRRSIARLRAIRTSSPSPRGSIRPAINRTNTSCTTSSASRGSSVIATPMRHSRRRSRTYRSETSASGTLMSEWPQDAVSVPGLRRPCPAACGIPDRSYQQSAPTATRPLQRPH